MRYCIWKIQPTCCRMFIFTQRIVSKIVWLILLFIEYAQCAAKKHTMNTKKPVEMSPIYDILKHHSLQLNALYKT